MKCCEYDHNSDGNCHIHAAPGILRNNPLPPATFSNLMNELEPGFDFRNWRESNEWKIFVAGMNEVARMHNVVRSVGSAMLELQDSLEIKMSARYEAK